MNNFTPTDVGVFLVKMYMVIVTLVHLCIILHPLIWMFFGQNV